MEVESGYLENYFGYGLNFYKVDNFPALQLVWTDRKNNFPWDKQYEEEFKYRQPLLDRNIDFKFREEKNLGIFTTRQWLDLNQPILRVVHDKDGDWQFLTGDQMHSDIKLVCFKDMISRDLTLNELFNLDYGEEAERNSVGGQWTRIKSEEEDAPE